ncbi:threonine synthase [Achromatium sp. WMS2]|nr:threonine synthase [Achromatium sp. WMS2]
MRYISTRGNMEPLSFSQAVMMGLATDGGLLLPETIPSIDDKTLISWSNLNFSKLAVEIMSLYVGDDIKRVELDDLAQRSYLAFSHPLVTPLVRVGEQAIIELFHGPTAAFKDIALQWLGNLFELLLQRSDKQLNILGATSGDTGSAAIYGVRGKKRIRIFILHPLGRVSLIQERQMTTVLDPNVHNIAIRGTFDDGQRIVKEVFTDLEFKQHYNLAAINSINWARVLAQIVYYFYAWGRYTAGNISKSVNFAVPTGNFGDIFAGYMAKRMGLPINKLIIATNRNDILTRFIATGVYKVGEAQPTLSPSMDIQLASNFERYLYYLTGANPSQVKAHMNSLSSTGQLQVTAEQLAVANSDFAAVAVSDVETLAQMRFTYDKYRYILDPHTAIGVKAAQDVTDVICIATAHPAKFMESVQRAIGKKPPVPSSLQGILDREMRCTISEANSLAVKQYICDVVDGSSNLLT